MNTNFCKSQKKILSYWLLLISLKIIITLMTNDINYYKHNEYNEYNEYKHINEILYLSIDNVFSNHRSLYIYHISINL